MVQKHFEEILSFDTHSSGNSKFLASFLLKKPPRFFRKSPNFERFEKSYQFSQLLRQICHILVMKSFQGLGRILTSRIVHHKLAS